MMSILRRQWKPLLQRRFKRCLRNYPFRLVSLIRRQPSLPLKQLLPKSLQLLLLLQRSNRVQTTCLLLLWLCPVNPPRQQKKPLLRQRPRLHQRPPHNSQPPQGLSLAAQRQPLSNTAVRLPVLSNMAVRHPARSNTGVQPLVRSNMGVQLLVHSSMGVQPLVRSSTAVQPRERSNMGVRPPAPSNTAVRLPVLSNMAVRRQVLSNMDDPLLVGLGVRQVAPEPVQDSVQARQSALPKMWSCLWAKIASAIMIPTRRAIPVSTIRST